MRTYAVCVALYDREAVRYDSIVRIPERLLFTGGRVCATAQAVGNLLEIAIGTARNLPHYRSEVRLTGVDISPARLAVAQERAHALGREIDLRVGDAQDIEFPSERFDSVVGTLALCTIPDDRRALAEALAKEIAGEQAGRAAASLAGAGNLEQAREQFGTLSEALVP